jgi:Mlc titration factor MtfA (ptsG expression regulator)
MLVTPDKNRHNQRLAVLLAALPVIVFGALACYWLWFLPGVLLSLPAYFFTRRQCVRRMQVMRQDFPPMWEAILRSRVAYFNALNEEDRDRFRQFVKVFLDETRITGIRTDVDEETRVLVAASAIIPVFRFTDWEYGHLGEVLIYPGSFDEDYTSDQDGDGNILGMVGLGHLSGVMILSKPSLLAGFANPDDKHNVGIHEFAHLVDQADGVIDGLPPGVPAEVIRPWIKWVAEELAEPPDGRSHVRKYAYTNEAEYFAVLTEYFFEAPDVLQRKNPELYALLQKMFRQDTATFLSDAKLHRPKRLGRNSRCPCGSGKKYKRCCLRRARQGVPR